MKRQNYAFHNNYDFHNEVIFALCEDQAIDGQLDYDDFPPEEYRYFSKLSKLGYMNRHKGLAKDICVLKQEGYRKEYRQACALRDERLGHMKRLQADMIRAADLSRQLNQARNAGDALKIALELIEKLLNEPGLARRIQQNLKDDKP